MVIARVWLAGCSPVPRERRKWFQRKKRTTFSESASLCSKLRFGEKLSEVSFRKSPSGFASSKVEQGKKKTNIKERGAWRKQLPARCPSTVPGPALPLHSFAWR